MEPGLHEDLEKLLAAVAREFANEGAAAEVAILAASKPFLVEIGYDNWNGGMYMYELSFQISAKLLSQVNSRREGLEASILEKIKTYGRLHAPHFINTVAIYGELVESPKWREKAMDWIEGRGISNQGRVRSDNVAGKSCDGLLFRSQPEILLYKALKASGVSFAPLPVFVRGGVSYQRIEPDFIIIREGVVLHVEVDGDTVHLETPAEAHARTSILLHEGVFVERVLASQCDDEDKARACAQKLLGVLDKHKRNQ